MQSSTNQHQQGENPKRLLDSPTKSFLHKPSKIVRTDTDHLSDEEKEEEPENQQVMNQNPRFQRYLIAIEYIGTRFSGSQKQVPNCRTVVGVLEEAFHKFIGQPVSIFCSSRTDAGVHALSNVCHVDVERFSKRKPGELLPPHEPGVVQRAVNHFLQKNEGDIAVIDVRCIPSDFHSRYKARERIYYYRLLSGPEALSTFEKDRSWHILEELDVFAMQKACKILVGEHDFSSFRAAGCQANSPIRTLDEFSVTEVFPTPYFPPIVEKGRFDSLQQNASLSSCGSSIEMPIKGSIADHCGVDNTNNLSHLEFGQRRRNRCYVITARARSFLYHQVLDSGKTIGSAKMCSGLYLLEVRLLVGVLKSVGVGNLTTDDVQRILDAKTVTAASPMAPACGLYLGQVKYVLP